MIRQLALGIATALGMALAGMGAAFAAVVPAIEDPGAMVSWSPIGAFTISFSPELVSSTPSGADDPVFAFFAGVFGNTELAVQATGGVPILTATGTGFTTDATGIQALLSTTLDETGLFGPRLLLTLAIPGFDPTAPFFIGTGALSITNAPAPIPLPAALPLLAGGLVGLWGFGRRARRA